MKRIVITLSLLVTAVAPAVAENLYDDLEILRARLLADRKAVIAENLGLTEEQSTAFWPVWERYQERVNVVRRARLDLVLDFLEKRHALTDDEAIELLHRAIDVKRSFANLEERWLKEFRRVLPAPKVARYYQIENKIDALINVELAAQVPLADGGSP
jgi:hypothetical protein